MPLCRSPLTLRLALFSRSRTAAVEIPRFILHRRRSEFLPGGGNKRSTGSCMFSNVNRLPDRVPGGFSLFLVRPTAKGACAPGKVIISMPRLVGRKSTAPAKPYSAPFSKCARVAGTINVLSAFVQPSLRSLSETTSLSRSRLSSTMPAPVATQSRAFSAM